MSEFRPYFQRAVVIGANGAIGSLFCDQLAAAGCSIAGIDLAPVSRPGLGVSHYACADACALNPAATGLIAAADIAILALPEDVALRAWPGIAAHLSPQCLTADTLSVKTSYCALVRQQRPAGEYISINPMFAPAAGFAGNNVAVIKLTDGPRTAAFISLIETWGARIAELTPERHDEMTAAIQVATHAAVIAFGMTLRRLNYDAAEAWPLTTPPHRTALGLVARICAGAPEVYESIQSHHPHAREVRRAMAESIADLSRITEANDSAGFRSLLQDLKPLLKSLPA